jgi:hypothetical protein
VIISHKYKFIFVKTQKVGGTSVEIALSKFLGPDDIVTPILEVDDEALRSRLGYCGPQNYNVTAEQFRREVFSLTRLGGTYAKQVLLRRGWPQRYYNHISANEIMNAIGQDIWKNYFKFTIERNPYDKVASAYYYYCRNEPTTFEEFVSSGRAGASSDFDQYCINRIPAMDFFVRYESFDPSLDEAAARIGLPEPLSPLLETIKAKTVFRKKVPIKSLYATPLKQIVDIQFAREISYFGYDFPEAV